MPHPQIPSPTPAPPQRLYSTAAALPASQCGQMYRLLAVTLTMLLQPQFEQDLAEKEWVTCTRISPKEVGRMKVSSPAISRSPDALQTSVDGQPLVAFFSGDSHISASIGVKPNCRVYGSSNVFSWPPLSRTSGVIYWFLISSGYKTYRFLPDLFAGVLSLPTAVPRHRTSKKFWRRWRT